MEWTMEIGCAYDADFSIGTLTGTGNISVQLKDYAGNNLTEMNAVKMYMTSDAAGQTTAQIAAYTAATGEMHEITQYVAYHVITNTSGLAIITLDGSGVSTTYMHIVLPNGRVKHSNIIKWAA